MNNMADRVNNGGLPGDVDGLAERVGQVSMDSDDSQPMSEDADLPSILIITNIHESVFNDPSMKVCNALNEDSSLRQTRSCH